MRKLALTLPLVLFLVACASVYTGVVTITSVVDSAMKEWAALSVKGQTSPSIDAAVIAAHNKYREAAALAQTALVTYKATGNQTEWTKALTVVRSAADGLIGLITPLLTPTKAATINSNFAKASTI